MLRPPINSLTYEFAFIRTNIHPINKNLDKISLLFNSIEYIKIKVNATKSCMNNKDKKHLNHDLQKLDVDCVDRDSIANGDIKTSTFINTYRIEYENIKFINPNEIVLFIIPSNENIFELFSSIKITEFTFSIKFAKHISVLKMSSPICFIAIDNSELREIIISQM